MKNSPASGAGSISSTIPRTWNRAVTVSGLTPHEALWVISHSIKEGGFKKIETLATYVEKRVFPNGP